jgi:phosphocarrier protein HPr
MHASSGKHGLDTIVINELGLHARSAAKVARIAAGAKGPVWLIRNGTRVDASSVIDILTLACVKGTGIRFEVDNPGDDLLLKQLVDLVERGFDE